MKIKSLMALAGVTIATSCFGYVATMAVSSGEIETGSWNSNFAKGKAYAEANNLPLVVFWASPGCSMCEKLEKAVALPDFTEWAASKEYVFVFSLGTATEDAKNAKSFAFNSSKAFPYICVYWKKADGTTIRNNFTGRSTAMPSREGKALQQKFINSIETVLGGTGTVTPSTPSGTSVPDYWNRAKTVDGVCYIDGSIFDGAVSVKLGKANKKTKLAKVTATVELLGSVKRTFSGKIDASKESFTLTSSYGSLTLSVTADGYTGTLACKDGNFNVQSTVFGGTYPSGTQLALTLSDYPEKYGTSPVLTEWLPGASNAFTFAASGSKWTLPSVGTIRWNKSAGSFAATKPDNPAGLKLSYKSRTGMFNGSYYTYVQQSSNKAKRLKTKITGYVVNGEGYGIAKCNGLDSALVTISPAK